ncbi:MAG: TIGR03663 family protein [Candidatus Methanoperedens sp.]|nr:TIGR03663 family protein [Candidatus Methanoperedens sp.]MCE8427709.1 TIGR03663 family protein [Candidatus Methanoperedens sp.]
MKNTQNGLFFFLILFSGIFLLAIFLRFYHLDVRVFHHDESAIGFNTYKFFKDGIYSYDPVFHGPFMYYVTAEVFSFFGDSDYSARILPAIFGASMLFLLLPLRKYIGTSGLLITAFFLALSPSFLYYSRFFREDIFIAFFSLLILVCAVKYTEKYAEQTYSYMRIFYLFLGGVGLASMAALKENAYIVMFLIILFLAMFFIREKWSKDFIGRIMIKKAVIISAEGLFFIFVLLVVFSLFYTGNVLDFHGMKDTVEKAVSYWYAMHKIAHLGGSPFYYLPILVRYELPVLVFGVIGIVHYFKKNNNFMIFLGYWAISNFMIYSYLQEKVPWLILNPLLPLTLVAGAYIGELLPGWKLNSKAGAIAVIFLAASSVFFIQSSVFLNFYDYTNIKEPLIQGNQVPQEFKEINLPKLYAWASELNGKPAKITLPEKQPVTTFLWYFRHYDNIEIYYLEEKKL